MNSGKIISLLPYQEPFLFVDEISSVSESNIEGNYKLRENAYFYEGHFKDNPVTPGVILTEIMAQIGLVSLGIFLYKSEKADSNFPQIALTSYQLDFFLPVFPGERVNVISEKEYFRFGKLKCNVQLLNEKGELVSRGTISGMINMKNEK